MSTDVEGDNFFAALSEFQNQPEKVIQNKVYFNQNGEIQKVSADPTTDNMGMDSIEPFMRYENKGVFILCLTSNNGSKDFQKLIILELDQ